MNCTEFEILLCDSIDGALTAGQRQTLDGHSASCASCRELVRDTAEAVVFLKGMDATEPPPDLVTRIVFHAPLGKVRQPYERRGFFSTAFGQWLQPVLQPRIAMGMAMTILSFAMLGRCTGVRVQQIKADDLSPAKVWNGVEDKVLRARDRAVKYYENLRLVYEIESRLKDLRDQQDTAPAAAAPKQEKEVAR